MHVAARSGSSREGRKRAPEEADHRAAGGLGLAGSRPRCRQILERDRPTSCRGDDTYRDLARLVEHFGKDKLLTEITNADVARLVAWRRGHRNKHTHALISPLTVNHSTTEALKKLFTYAKSRNARFDHEPRWRNHMLKEPEERVRELAGDEGERLAAVTRDDYRPFFDFVVESGFRKRECVFLRWGEVNWSTGQIVELGKGGRRITKPLTPTLRAILEPL